MLYFKGLGIADIKLLYQFYIRKTKCHVYLYDTKITIRLHHQMHFLQKSAPKGTILLSLLFYVVQATVIYLVISCRCTLPITEHSSSHKDKPGFEHKVRFLRPAKLA